MRVDRWTYFATRYSLLAARGSGAGLRNFFILVLSSQFSVLTSTFLVPRDLEIPFGRPLCPCAGDEAGVSAEVLDRAVDHVMLGRAVLVLAIPFEVDVPSLGIQRRNPQRHAVRAGIDGPGDGFAVPIQIENDVRAITGTVSPIAAPRAFERVAELCESRGGDGEEKRDDGQETKRTYHPWGPFLLLAACYSRLAACGSLLAARYSLLATCYFSLLTSYFVAAPAFASKDRFFEKNGSTLVSTRSYTLLVWSPSYSSYVCLTPKFVNISSSCLFDARRPSFVPTSIPMALYIFKCGMY